MFSFFFLSIFSSYVLKILYINFLTVALPTQRFTNYYIIQNPLQRYFWYFKKSGYRVFNYFNMFINIKLKYFIDLFYYKFIIFFLKFKNVNNLYKAYIPSFKDEFFSNLSLSYNFYLNFEFIINYNFIISSYYGFIFFLIWNFLNKNPRYKLFRQFKSPIFKLYDICFVDWNFFEIKKLRLIFYILN